MKMISMSLSVQRISHDILSLDEAILSVSVMDARTGTTLAVSSKASFRNQYKITEVERKSSGTWAIVILGLVSFF
jgi:cell division protein FtsI/penicillin-binding protein 2